MIARLGADLVMLVHFGFILAVIFGGLLVLRYPRAAWLHLPVAAWGAGIEITGGVCPLTHVENRLRRMAGEQGYEASFVEHYLAPVIYPGGLTRHTQLVLAALVLLINALIYGWAWRRRRGDG